MTPTRRSPQSRRPPTLRRVPRTEDRHRHGGMHGGRCRRGLPPLSRRFARPGCAHGLYPALSDSRATMGYMCGRFAVTTDPALLAEKIQAIDEITASAAAATKDTPGPNYNVAPTTTITTVVKRHNQPDDESTRRVRLMRWGLVPPWAKTAGDGGPDTKGPLLLNARSEKVTASPAFRNSAK